MSEAVLISIRPKWVEKIANGEKTIEVRKTRPKKAEKSVQVLYLLHARQRRTQAARVVGQGHRRVYLRWVLARHTAEYQPTFLHGRLYGRF